MRINNILLLFFTIIVFGACRKDWLDTKSDQSIVVPTTLDDFEAALANTSVFNENQPSLLELGCDDYYHTSSSLSNKTQGQKNIYTWAGTSNFYAEQSSKFEWDNVYLAIFYSNRILEGLQEVKQPDRSERWNNLKGSALFFRSFANYNLVSIYSKAYDKNSAASDLGIILRLESDINLKAERASVKESYDRIISDLLEAIPLLPNKVLVKTSPTKAAAYALLARVYLFTGEFEKALKASTECINLADGILDYNTVAVDAISPFAPLYTKEVIFYSRMVNSPLFPLANGTGFVDTVVLRSYGEKDLRKRAFFRNVNGRMTFKGSYSSLFFVLFNGLAIDEVYLIRAECLARADKNSESLSDLNKLLSSRYEAGSFQPISTMTSKESLSIILKERRKELLCRGVRWVDIKRLNEINEGPGTLTRLIGGSEFKLAPKDNRYVYPLPNSEITVSDVPQNPR
ncbi:RagB/SusD family nutrient uptake outer membrane protein [Paraflavitalea sp. CAU 1676]|uniref:RagB/SusD family nutrient uptake outer membrane protein n=1 Tax=Paraflavitalea sp. CAU 1676 TaxID=3032598 RepID=UPI0023DAB017|nr:RagB/SusD family nutrient uptake outer membrane protein [Paraflavitalea sp. CAU 1676]MDF2191231.1 RagB/SusD family nutrient uptake outer membrane protein [Paraflavitalea sp. CAU 1676]